MRRELLRLSIALLATVGGCRPSASAPPPPSSRHPLLDQPLPDFRRAALDGSGVNTAALRGRVVVVDFFAKYCEPCRRTLPELRALSRERPDIAVIGIAEDEREADAEELVNAYALPFPVVLDREHVLSGRFRVRELPATFVADPSGRIRWFSGPEQATGAAPSVAKTYARAPEGEP